MAQLGNTKTWPTIKRSDHDFSDAAAAAAAAAPAARAPLFVRSHDTQKCSRLEGGGDGRLGVCVCVWGRRSRRARSMPASQPAIIKRRHCRRESIPSFLPSFPLPSLFLPCDPSMMTKSEEGGKEGRKERPRLLLQTSFQILLCLLCCAPAGRRGREGRDEGRPLTDGRTD